MGLFYTASIRLWPRVEALVPRFDDSDQDLVHEISRRREIPHLSRFCGPFRRPLRLLIATCHGSHPHTHTSCSARKIGPPDKAGSRKNIFGRTSVICSERLEKGSISAQSTREVRTLAYYDDIGESEPALFLAPVWQRWYFVLCSLELCLTQRKVVISG